MRLHAMRELGFKEAWVIHIRCSSKAELVEISLADNDRAGAYDEDLLAELLFPFSEQITFEDYSVDLSQPISVENIVLAASPEFRDPHSRIEQAEQLRKQWGAEQGQVWRIGDSYLIIGSSEKPEIVQAVKELIDPQIIVTDPPYEMEAEKIDNIISLYSNRAIMLLGGRQAFTMCRYGWEWRLDLVWDHRTPSTKKAFSRPVYYHTNIVYYTKGDAPFGWKRPRKDFGSIIRCDHEYKFDKLQHGKSAESSLRSYPALKIKTGVDPFVGTGASIIACEFMKKRVAGIEISPEIAAVALDRLERASLPPKLESTHLSEVQK